LNKIKRQNSLIGEVVSDKMDKTIVVKVGRLVRHPVFNKMVYRAKKYKAHDHKNECRIGDKVQIGGTRPLSKDKRWRVLEIILKAPGHQS
jgi:small subunit ribosomal protein S17|tara:strand:+ start:329 stop:598 length:270 start_codon:yes stop_codon:yes gene_type:complete